MKYDYEKITVDGIDIHNIRKEVMNPRNHALKNDKNYDIYRQTKRKEKNMSKPKKYAYAKVTVADKTIYHTAQEVAENRSKMNQAE